MAQAPKKKPQGQQKNSSRAAGKQRTSGRPEESTATPAQRKRAAVDESGAKLD